MRGKHKNSREHKLRRRQEEQAESAKNFQKKNSENEKKIKQKPVSSIGKPAVRSNKQEFQSKSKGKWFEWGNIKQQLPKTATSKFILIFSAMLVLATVLYISDLVMNKKDYEGYTAYFDENLNFGVDIPSKWAVGVPQKDSIKEIVQESTSGLTFDTSYATLTQEIVPLSLIQQDPTGKFPYKRMMIVSMFGHENPNEYMNDKGKMEEEFKAILQELGHEGIRIEKVEDAYNGTLNGVILYAKSFFEGKKMHYIHYTERLDKNILRILYGSTDVIKKPKELEEFMSTFVMYETDILEQLMEQGINPEDLESNTINPSGEKDLSEHDHDHADHDHDEDGGVVKEKEDGKLEVDFTPKFENDGDIEASVTE